jgi:hypothetical protein
MLDKTPQKCGASRLLIKIYFLIGGDFLLPVNLGGHAAYQEFLLDQIPKYYPDPSFIPSDIRKAMDRFWYKDLSLVDDLMKDRYSRLGAPSRLPSDMLRSMLLAAHFHVNSFTKWAAQLKLNPLFAILSGFPVGDTPGVGTFYDFAGRLWNSDSDNISPKEMPPKIRVRKPSSKGAKASSIEKISVEKLIGQYEQKPASPDQPFSRLFSIFQRCFLDESVDRGLIRRNSLSVAGDGTPVVCAAQERKKRTCKCKENGVSDCKCNRIFSQPDADIGWDSHRGCFYFGYDLYMLTAADSGHDLPVFPLFGPASRHDSHGFIHAWFNMKAFLPEFTVSKLLLDSAHDAMAVYEYCRRSSITPFIDLNIKRGIKVPYKNDFTIGEDGVPVCMAGLKMRHDGCERKKHRLKFRCPLHSKKHGCRCKQPCTGANYGRTVHLAMKDNPRLINFPPRDSEEWKKEYNARTSAERCNKREKIDYKLESGRHRSTKMWYCRLYCIMMLQHLDAWELSSTKTLSKALEGISYN